jgi:glycosyltransferase involved in cell wall biosynthesis
MPNAKTLCIDLRWIDASGVGIYIKGILPGLVENLKDISIIGVGDRARLASFCWHKADNMRLVDCRAGRYSIREQFELPRAIPPGVDLFFSPYYTIPLFYRGRIAVTVHDMSHMVVSEIVGNWRKRHYARTMYRELRRRAALIFTVSEFTRKELIRLTQGPADNIVPTPLGVFPEWYSAKERSPVRTRPYFVCVGNIKPYKNIGRLAEAYLKVMGQIPQDLVIIGQNEGLITGESPEFFQQIRAVNGRVHLTGFVSHDELLALVGYADALIMPSLYEGFGLPPLEAMAAGVPVAVSRAGSLPEVCGEAALYFDPLKVEDMANCMLELASHSTLRRQLVEAGAERSRAFKWETCANTTAHALRTCLDEG